MDQYDLIAQDPRTGGPRRTQSPLLRGLLAGAAAFAILTLFGVGILLIGYAAIASRLPSPGDLTSRASSFQSTRIYDRNGVLLNETFDPNAGRRTAVSLDRISPHLIQATIATEDANFYRHQGVDPVALGRAVYYAVREGDVVSGGSTIPQQLVKMVFLSPERTITRKVKEAILSAEISRRYSKEQILEIYLNELYYGNFAYGADAAAETYFSKDVADLTLAEAALLAGLPQLPAYYDPYIHPERAKERQGVVLGLMVEQGMISQAEADAAWLEPLVYTPVEFELNAPHFTLYVRQQLEALLGPEALYQSGLEVTTSLDSDLQDAAQRMVSEHVASLADRNVSNGALVAMNPTTGELLALVGSADFDNVEIDGQVNMALAPRQPGSSTKPFVYLTAFEQPDKPPADRWTPGTLVADIEEAFPDGANPPYVPKNYDGKEHGMVTVRRALGSSYNIPAVRALETVGVQTYVDRMRQLGITTLDRPDYGLSLSLGSGEIPLIELTDAFAALANQGVRIPPQSILEIKDSAGNVLCKLGTDRPCQPGSQGEPVIDPVDAFLFSDMLSDNEARTPAFGPNSVLRLDRPAAVKTGTTNDIRDNLTVGYTPQLVTGVWVGNADNSPMSDVSGVTGAGPIWNRFMGYALAGQPIIPFTPPQGVRAYEVCADTGTLPSDACPERRQHFYAADRPPLPPSQDLWQFVRLDRTTGRLATEYTPPEAIEEKRFKIYPPEYRQWAEENGIPQPPLDDGAVGGVELAIIRPVEGEIVQGVVDVFGTANASDFASYELQYGISHDPGAFSPPIAGPYGSPVINGMLGRWDVRGLENGPHTLRLLVRDRNGALYETRVRLTVENPPATATATWTPLPTLEPTPTWTPLPVLPPTATWTPLPTLPPVPPTDTPLPPTVVPPTLAPTETPTLPPAPPTDTPLPPPTATEVPPAPTETPVEPPTPLPTLEPTPTEVIPPTVGPTDVPTAAPTVAPTATITGSGVITGTGVVTP
jgi:1A family penicillin-binding protein